MIFNIERTRKDFPILNKKIIYFDNACLTLKPKQVIDKIREYYEEYTACAGRSTHQLSEQVQINIDKTREEAKKFVNAKHSEELIFCRNTTEGINLLSRSFGLQKGDEVILTDKEHNSNLIPWLYLKKKGISVRFAETKEDGTLDMDSYEKCFNNKTKLVSVVHTSNLDGVVNPVEEMGKVAHDNNVKIHIDGAQSAPHKKIDVRKMNADFYTFSGHKMLGPTGTGVLYGKKESLEEMEPYVLGGQTVVDSTEEGYELASLPKKYEAGLQDYAGIIGLSEAFKYLLKVGLNRIEKHEHKLNRIMWEELNEKVKIFGPENNRSGVFSFTMDKISPHEISTMLDKSKNILTRSGAHCVHSWFNKRKIQGTTRASLYLYNTEEEVKTFVEEIKKIRKLVS